VIGLSTSWIGVYGESDEFEGVRGKSNHKDHAGVVGTNDAGGAAMFADGAVGLQGIGKTWVGVYGETQAGPDAGSCGVLGEGKNGGDGVKGHASGQGKAAVAGFHLTNRGPGVYGEGSPAGRFKGNVEVTGALSVAGIGFAAVLAKLAALESQMADLTARVARLENRPVPTAPPSIAVNQESQKIKVNGSAFKPNNGIRIRLVVGMVGNETSVTTTSSANGGFTHHVSIAGVSPGTTMWVSATDGTPNPSDLTGVRWSNTVQFTVA
jgi:hypothetical protein